MREPRPGTGGDGLGPLAARLAALEETVTRVDGDVSALGRGLANATSTLRNLGAADPDGEDEPDGQRDWLTVTDDRKAREWLVAAANWVTTGPGHLSGLAVTPCWVLHPDVVADVLALQAFRAAAYSGRSGSASAVCDWLGRWLPDGRDRVARALRACRESTGHRTDEGVWDARDLDPNEVATWWARDRRLPFHAALQLRRLDQ